MPEMPAGYREACYAIGQVAFAWSAAERMFIACVLRLYHAYNQRHDPYPPISLKRQIRFFRRSLSEIGMSDEHQASGTHIADWISKLSQRRHWVVHGFAYDIIDRQVGDSISFERFEKAGSAKIEQETYTLGDLDKLRHECWVLAGAIMLFYGQALKGFPKEKIDEMLSKLGS